MGYVIIIIISILIIIGFCTKERQRQRENFKLKYHQFCQQKDRLCNQLDDKIERANIQLQQKEKELNKLKGICEIYEAETKKRIDNSAESYKEKAMQFVKNIVRQQQEKEEAAAKQRTQEVLKQFAEQQQMAEEALQEIMDSLEQQKMKREAINEEIRRQREIEQKKDFYRVCLSEEAIADIQILSETRKNLKKPEFIDKIIYDNYISKPVLEMIKRVLQNTTCSGIYKITCVPTKEIYIGKSTDIKNRWQQHCKTAFNCGTIASSLLHTKMKTYGIENFTFELLEKVPKEQLTEREKYYINFYQTKEVGLNERNG